MRIAIVGGGAAGAACAYALSRDNDDGTKIIHLYESCASLGGVATTTTTISTKMDNEEKKQTLVFNDGVQGGAESYRNTLMLLKECNCPDVNWLNVRVSFGKGKNNWTNYKSSESSLIREHREEIRKFGQLLKRVKRYEWYYAFRSIESVLSANSFSKDFRERIVYPLVALFFGTGNQTKNVSSVLFARVFTDERLRLYDYDERYFLSQTPRMMAFPPFEDVYRSIQEKIERQGVKVFLGRTVEKVERNRKTVKVYSRKRREGGADDEEKKEAAALCEDTYDRIVFACNTEQTEKMLTQTKMSFMEKFIFKNITYFDDVSVTHMDREYMERHYDETVGDMYFVKTYDDSPDKIEMSFDLKAYQPSLNQERCYQSIFLDRASDEHKWTKHEIDPKRTLLTKWWRQFGHTVQHFTRSVPLWRFVQGKRNTYYAGSYTLVNTHEIAVISGFAAAFRLGAKYPFEAEDDLGQFDLYLSLIHGTKRRKS